MEIFDDCLEQVSKCTPANLALASAFSTPGPKPGLDFKDFRDL